MGLMHPSVYNTSKNNLTTWWVQTDNPHSCKNMHYCSYWLCCMVNNYRISCLDFEKKKVNLVVMDGQECSMNLDITESLKYNETNIWCPSHLVKHLCAKSLLWLFSVWECLLNTVRMPTVGNALWCVLGKLFQINFMYVVVLYVC